MKKDTKDVEAYLAEVRRYLGNLPDADAIIEELRSHIWETANTISIEDGVSVNDAFGYAISQMEEPKKLAQKFIAEDGEAAPVDEVKASEKPATTTATTQEQSRVGQRVERLRQPTSPVPESKVSNEQFMLLAGIGFIIMMVLAAGVSIDTQQPLVFLIALVLGTSIIGFFTFLLYVYDDQLFKEQLANLREKFTKFVEDINVSVSKNATSRVSKPVTSDKKRNVVFVRKDEQHKVVSTPSGRRIRYVKPQKSRFNFWTVSEHLAGVFALVFQIIFIMFILWLDYGTDVPIFADTWYYTGMAIVFTSVGIEMLASLIRIITGRIRATRLISAFVNVVQGACNIALVVIFPFTFNLAATYIFTGIVDDPEALFYLTNYSDVTIRVIIGVVAAIQFMKAFYDIFKFGSWKPQDNRSLLVEPSNSE